VRCCWTGRRASARWTWWSRSWCLPIGLGTVTFQVFLVVGVTGLLRGRMDSLAWQWLHRLSYAGFGLLVLHVLLTGTDTTEPVIAGLMWATAGLLAILTAARIIWGRLPA
jgi:DMSO/TMAO reductase YedYZ heme-binding membrane subunit